MVYRGFGTVTHTTPYDTLFSDQQRVLSRAEGLVERSFEAAQECNSLIDRCKREIEMLRNERKKLTDRVKEIDGDLDEVQ